MRILLSVLPAVLCAQQIQNLGPQAQSIDFESSILFNSCRATHWVGFHDSVVGEAPTQLHHVNMSTGRSYTINTAKTGRGNVYGKTISAANGKLYFTTTAPCYFYEYGLNGALRQITASTWARDACGSNLTDKTGQQAAEGPNGTVLIGTGVRGTLFSYDPASDLVTDYGVIDPPTGNPTCIGCYRYVYTLQADASYAYLGMRDARSNRWWLVMLRLSDGQQTACFERDNATNGMVSRRTSDNAVVYQSRTTWYLVNGAQGCTAFPIATPTTAPYYMPGATYFQNSAQGYEATLFKVDLDLSSVPADSSTGAVTTLRYRLPAGWGSWMTSTTALAMVATVRR